MTSTSSPATVRLASRIQPRRPPKLRQSLIRNPPLKMEDRAEGLEKYAQQCISSQINSVLKDGVQEINYDQMVRDLELLDGEMRLFVIFVRETSRLMLKHDGSKQSLVEQCGLKDLGRSSPCPNLICHTAQSRYHPTPSSHSPFIFPISPISFPSSSIRD